MRRGELVVAVNFGDQPTELLVDGDLELLFRTPAGPTLSDARLDLPAHAGVLMGPARR
jgi:maltooligosyltrehalose trehalohydrolase